jgi:hypothetical protein
VLTSPQAPLRLATLRWLGVFICALATLLSSASAYRQWQELEGQQTRSTSGWLCGLASVA